MKVLPGELGRPQVLRPSQRCRQSYLVSSGERIQGQTQPSGQSTCVGKFIKTKVHSQDERAGKRGGRERERELQPGV